MKDSKEHIFSLGQIDIDLSKFSEAAELNSLPILPTRDLVLFPGVTFPITLGREESIHTAEMAERTHNLIGIVCQHDPNVEHPNIPEDIMEYGVLAHVVKVLEIPDGPKTAILRATQRIRVTGEGPAPLTAMVEVAAETEVDNDDKELQAYVNSVRSTALSILHKTSDAPNDLTFNLETTRNPEGIINIVATHAPFSPQIKQELLECPSVKERAIMLLSHLSTQEEMVDITNKIKERTKSNMTEGQRVNFLQHQMEAIRQEIYGDDDEATEFRKKAQTIDFPDTIRDIFEKEVDKLSRLNPSSPDYTVQYSYLELLLDLPWNKLDDVNTNLKEAENILNADHFGLEKVKERILEQLAVMMHTQGAKSPILCLVGAPGVGKTSLGQSIARALGRKYQRVSLGGLHDESEIRGHRRTYIGAMPGRIIDAMRRAGTSNPVLLLDEIDKIGTDIKSDPAAALLEVLDPEQNCRFHDNYVDVDYDLSKVLFIATANTLSTLSQPLLDRMEIIDVSGYLQEEKVEIAKRHLIPRILNDNGFTANSFKFETDAIVKIIEGYTSESGVRQLEKKLASIIRKMVLKKMRGQRLVRTIKPQHIPELLGVETHIKDVYQGNSYAGVVTGLAWTAVGGEILFIESSLAPGKGEKITLTGNLGDVMKESAIIALQYIKAHASNLNIPAEVFEKYSIHLHVPEGAIPKDGPSAGITMATALASLLTQRKVRDRIAMTGEITLRGKVLPVGGIKEKILAAKRAGIDTIILSSANKKDIDDIARIYIDGLKFVYVEDVSEVLDFALLPEIVDNALKIQ